MCWWWDLPCTVKQGIAWIGWRNIQWVLPRWNPFWRSLDCSHFLRCRSCLRPRLFRCELFPEEREFPAHYSKVWDSPTRYQKLTEKFHHEKFKSKTQLFLALLDFPIPSSLSPQFQIFLHLKCYLWGKAQICTPCISDQISDLPGEGKWINLEF